MFISRVIGKRYKPIRLSLNLCIVRLISVLRGGRQDNYKSKNLL